MRVIRPSQHTTDRGSYTGYQGKHAASLSSCWQGDKAFTRPCQHTFWYCWHNLEPATQVRRHAGCTVQCKELTFWYWLAMFEKPRPGELATPEQQQHSLHLHSGPGQHRKEEDSK